MQVESVLHRLQACIYAHLVYLIELHLAGVKHIHHGITQQLPHLVLYNASWDTVNHFQGCGYRQTWPACASPSSKTKTKTNPTQAHKPLFIPKDNIPFRKR